MKKILFLLTLILLIIKSEAQNYQISFTGSGAATTVSSVQVQNLTKGTSLTLNGSDILHLTGTAGVDQLTSEEKSIRIYPNPTTTNSNIEFELSNAGLITVELYDITGKQILSNQTNLQVGSYTFIVDGLNSGVYTLTIKSDNINYSGKIISNCKTSGIATITYTNNTSKNYVAKTLKSTNAVINMAYTTGDVILLKGISGIYTTIKTLVPTSNSTQTFNFVKTTDYDGNNYGTVTIGAQVWMTENLRVTHYRTGVAIPNVTDNTAWSALTTGACSDYANTPANSVIYGKLYNWYAVSDTRNIAPAGWHVPTNAELTTLITYLGGETLAGGKMKETGTAHWGSPNTGATNESGFAALPTGSRSSSGTFLNLGVYGNTWTSTVNGTADAYVYYMFYGQPYCKRTVDPMLTGLVVRLVKD